MIQWFKNLAWIVQIRWIIYTNRRNKNYGWDDVPPPPKDDLPW